MAKSSKSRPYRIRESQRAKHVNIRVSHLGEVEVVVPKGFDLHKLPAILERRQDWIAKTTQRIVSERQAFDAGLDTALSDAGLPAQMSFRSIKEEWQILYQPVPTDQITAKVTALNQLTIRGAIEQPQIGYRLLRQWLNRKADYSLVPWLYKVSEEVGLPFNRAAIRGQKTLWASCSAQHNISLNFKLLFLPPHLVRYVFIHELCHTIHLNHSAAFWSLVEQKDPDYRANDQELNKAWIYIPTWIEGAQDAK